MGFWFEIVHPINTFRKKRDELLAVSFELQTLSYQRLTAHSSQLTALCLFISMCNFTQIYAQIQPNNILLNKNIAKDSFSNPTILADTAQNRSIDYKNPRTLGLRFPKDTAKVDSIGKKDSLLTGIVYSKDSLDAPVEYSAKDSIIYDNGNNLIHLYGSASVKYTTISLTAQYISIDTKNSIAEAVPLPDTAGKMKGIPHFKDSDQDFTVNKLRYNFKTKKGLAYDITTKQKDVYVHGGLSKFVSTAADSVTERRDVAYSQGAIFTTCNAPHPHFGIVSQKQKVIANSMIIVGPSQLYIGDVPTPLWLPFAFFPLTRGAHTGLIFPKDYTSSPTDGYGLNGVGWYFPISENLDVQAVGDVYVKGTFGLRATVDYVKRYNYNGSFTLSTRSQRNEDALDNITRSNSWSVQWNHSKDSRVNPTLSFNASLNMAGSASKSAPQSNLSGSAINTYQTVTQSNLNSNISMSKQFPGQPYSLSGSFSHSQNLNTRDFNVTFPNLNFQLQTIYPFKRKVAIGTEQWYEKITFQYQGQFNGRISTKDSLLFTDQMWKKALTGASHTMSSSVNFNLFKYFNVSPFINYNEYWYLRKQNRMFNKDSFLIHYDSTKIVTFRGDTVYDIKPDTLKYGNVDTAYQNGFNRVYNLNTGVSLNTRIFGLLNFKSGWLRAIRHTISPTFSFSYSPDNRRYLDSVRNDTRSPFQNTIYNRYEDAIFGAPSTSGASAGMSYSFSNLFEYKSFNSKDSTFHKGKLIFDNINIGGSYNALADSFKWSRVSMGTGTNLFNGLSSISIAALFDPYGRTAKGARTQTFAYQQNGQLLNFENLQLSINTRISILQIRDFFGEKDNDGKSIKKELPKGSGAEYETLWDFLGAFAFNHYFAMNITRPDNTVRDTFTFQHTLNTSGSFPLSKRWRLTLSNIGYDFVRETLTYPDLGFTTNLHCWEMGMNWQPLRNTYQFFLRVKPGSLDFLKLPYNKYQ